MNAQHALSHPEANTNRPSAAQVFGQGMRDTIPLVIGAIPFGIIFGALAVTSGLSPAATMAFSLFVFAGSAQFIAAGLFAQGAGALLIVLTTAIVNLRHALYGASLGPYVRGLPQRWLVPLAFWLTDETYAVVIRRWQAGGVHGRWYQLGSSLLMYGNWQLCTLIGIVAGTQLEGITEWGLDFAMVVTFIGIVVPFITTRPMLLCAVVAGATGVLTHDFPNNSGLVIAAVAGIVAGVVAEGLNAGNIPTTAPHPSTTEAAE